MVVEALDLSTNYLEFFKMEVMCISNKKSSVINENCDKAGQSLANSIASHSKTKVRVTEKLKVTGTSFIPSEANVFVEIMTVKEKD